MRPEPRRKSAPTLYLLFLGMVMLLFCGILVFAYRESKIANPIMLDEQGHVKADQP